jgi:prolyl 4-hydroxylase
MNNFIGQYYLKDNLICDELINYHKKSNQKYKGISTLKYDPKIKSSTDVVLQYEESIALKYLKNLQIILDQYINDYSFCNFYNAFEITELINIQHYALGEGFFAWHTERESKNFPQNIRHLAFMTYLNDINANGETEFYYQKLKVKPKKGLTLLWPVDWTHTHRGIPSLTEEKYIITGWFSFI